MKKLILIAIATLVTTSALIGCGKDNGTGNANGYYVDPYGNGYDYNNNYGGPYGGYAALRFVFGDTGSVLNRRTYHDFLRGDFCTHFLFFNFTCKMVDNPPIMVLALERLEMPAGNNGRIRGNLTINVMPDYGYMPNGQAYPKKEIPLDFVYGGSTNVLVGQNRDWYTEGNRTPRRIQVYLTGLKKDTRSVNVQVDYDQRPMLNGYLRR